MPRLTKPLLNAIAAALDSALAGEGFDGGDFTGMEQEHFERAREWVGEQLTDMNLKLLVRKAAEAELLREALRVIAEVDDDGFTSDGHERAVEWATRALAKVTD